MADQPNWEQATLEKLLLETLAEQRRKRRWGIFFKLIFLVFIAVGLFWSQQSSKTDLKRTRPHTAVIAIHGIIDDNSQASADAVMEALQEAFDEKNVQGIILAINSPGGSAVQASYLYNEVLRLRNLHKNIPIYAVCEDFCASAAYYVASSTQAIYANPASLVGSIGVMIESFGLTEAMNKLGIQRRLIIAGDNKGFLDPFSPLKKPDLAYAQQMLDEVHAKFIQDVKQGRGNRLKINNETFSGRAWTGIGAKPLGLIDDFGSTGSVARDVIKNKNIVPYNAKNTLFEQLAGEFNSSFKHAIQSEFTSSGIS